MKKFMLLAVMIAGLLSFTQANAQRASLMPLAAGDTVTNTGTASKTFTATAGYEGVAIQPILAKISGTVAGTIVLYESLDGTNYKSTGDTITNTNAATNTVIWHKVAPVPVFYKVTATGSGTMSAVLSIYYVARRHN